MGEYNINMELIGEKILRSRTAIHCDDKSKALALLGTLKQLGYKWASGQDLVDSGVEAYQYKQETCYDLRDGSLRYGSKRCYEEDLHYEIVEFDDLLIEPTIDAESFCNFLGGISGND